MSCMVRKPKVSVCVVTFNQEAYIERCLQSIVDQKAPFEFEVIVGDDCSTDSTRAIVTRFAEKYPDIVRPLFNSGNIGALANYKMVHSHASGEYVAHMDGDDCALPGKLARQVKILDENNNCTLVAHRMALLKGEIIVDFTRSNPESISLADLLLNHPMFLNSSIMYRRDVVGNIFFNVEDFIDYYVYVYSALNGEIMFINDVLGQYSINIGISSNRTLMPYIMAAIDLAQGVASEKVINVARSRQFRSYAIASLMERDDKKFIEYLSFAKKYNNSTFLSCMFVLRSLSSPLRYIFSIYKYSRSLIGGMKRAFN